MRHPPPRPPAPRQPRVPLGGQYGHLLSPHGEAWGGGLEEGAPMTSPVCKASFLPPGSTNWHAYLGEATPFMTDPVPLPGRLHSCAGFVYYYETFLSETLSISNCALSRGGEQALYYINARPVQMDTELQVLVCGSSQIRGYCLSGASGDTPHVLLRAALGTGCSWSCCCCPQHGHQGM